MFENRKPETGNRKPPLRICVPVVEATVNRARGKYQRAARKGLWTEIRLDYLEEPTPDLQKLFRTLPGPVIATNRLFAEGGGRQGDCRRPPSAKRRLVAITGPGRVRNSFCKSGVGSSR